MYCKFCGKNINDGSVFCTYCGAELTRHVNPFHPSDDSHCDDQPIPREEYYKNHCTPSTRNKISTVKILETVTVTLVSIIELLAVVCSILFLVRIKNQTGITYSDFQNILKNVIIRNLISIVLFIPFLILGIKGVKRKSFGLLIG